MLPRIPKKGKSQEGEVTADKSGAKAKEAMDSFGDGEVEAGKKSAAEAAAKAAGAAETVAGKGAKRGAAVYTALATVLAAGVRPSLLPPRPSPLG